MLSQLGFSLFDILLPLACTVGAIFGSLTHGIMVTIEHGGPPNEDSNFRLATKDEQELRGLWLSMRMFVGGVLGFVFGLYFVGTLHETPATFAKIWALSFIVGYAAPKIWTVKEAAIVRAAKADELEKPVS